MTTELTQPQIEMGPDPAMGQAQGHRRRRRRRKNKSSQVAGAPQQLQQAPPQAPPPMAPPPPTVSRPAKHKQAAQQNRRQDAQPNQGRKKKSFTSKNSAPQAQPGNNNSAQPQRKRKGTQKGPREFVGPMDHSYRAVNGNVADGPPSTIQISNGARSSGQYMDAYPPPSPVAVRADAPVRIFCFIEDLFFVAKIQETARKLGVKVEFVKGDKEAVARLTELPEAERPKLVVFDLNNLNAKPISLIPKLKAKFKKATSIVGFLNHLQGELKAKALEAGCDAVMPRSAFSQTLPNLLRRYGVEEEEDNTPQPL